MVKVMKKIKYSLRGLLQMYNNIPLNAKLISSGNNPKELM